MNLINTIIGAAVASLLPSEAKKIKSGFEKVKEFIPMVGMYHNGIPLNENETGIAYLIKIENDKINLYQCTTSVTSGALSIPRILEKFDVIETVEKFLTDNNVG